MTNSTTGSAALFALVAFASVSCAQTLVPADMENWWRWQGNLTDSITGASGTSSGAIGYTPGPRGHALRLGQSGSAEVTIPSSVGNFATRNFSISYWVRPETPAYASILNKRTICNAANLVDIRSGSAATGPVLAFEMYESWTPTSFALIAPPPSTGEWTHITHTREGATWRTYANGALVATANNRPIVNLNNAAPWRIGRSVCIGTDDTGQFVGAIDDLRFYGRALSQAEILALATGPSIESIDAPPTICDGATISSVAFNLGSAALQWQYRTTGTETWIGVSDGPIAQLGIVASGSATRTLRLDPAPTPTSIINQNFSIRLVATTSSFRSVSAPAQITACASDFDCTGYIDSDDFVYFVGHFVAGCIAPGMSEIGPDSTCFRAADLDRSGFLDVDDFVFFVSSFSQACQ